MRRKRQGRLDPRLCLQWTLKSAPATYPSLQSTAVIGVAGVFARPRGLLYAVAMESVARSKTYHRPVKGSVPQDRSSAMRPLVVCVDDYGADGWRWLEPVFPEYDWRFFRLNQDRHQGLKGQQDLFSKCWHAVRFAEKNRDRAILVSHGAQTALRCASLRRLIGGRAPHISYTFHFESMPGPFKTALIRQTIPGFDRIVVYTTSERDEFREHFRIDHDKIEMIHWGAREPDLESCCAKPIESGDYICTVGANARDYRTLMAAMERRPDIRLVAVVRPRSLQGIDVPENVTVYTNISSEDCWNIMSTARFFVLPLMQDASGGHSVLVQAMFMKKPLIVSDNRKLSDYLIGEDSALVYRSGDVESLVSKIDMLWEDRSLGESLGASTQEFAREHCTEGNIASHFRQYVESQRGFRPRA